MMSNNATERMTNSDLQNWFRNEYRPFSGLILYDQPLSRHTYYRIGGPAAVFCVPKTLEDLAILAKAIQETESPFFILGNGSNILAADAGFPGIVISIGRLNLELGALPPHSGNSHSFRIRTGSSVAISTLLRRASQEGWAGLEFLTGIPGTIGGVVTMNGGTHLGETQGRLRRVEVFSLIHSPALSPGSDPSRSATPSDLTVFESSQLQFQYRKNLFLPKGSVIIAAEWEVEPGNPTEVKASIDQILARRKSTQPLDFPSCGSVFKNPKSFGFHAWQVVDQLGLRGHRIGGAQISEKHSNFILNLGDATAEDVRSLIELVKGKAKEEMGIELEEEVIYL